MLPSRREDGGPLTGGTSCGRVFRRLPPVPARSPAERPIGAHHRVPALRRYLAALLATDVFPSVCTGLDDLDRR